MILVEIYIACIDKSYDFRLEKTATVEDIIEEIITVVSQKEDIALNINKEELTLSIVSKEIIMNGALTLADYNVKQGMKLILV
jgi:uncharacterized ubiquitin-like protein YukD